MDLKQQILFFGGPIILLNQLNQIIMMEQLGQQDLVWELQDHAGGAGISNGSAFSLQDHGPPNNPNGANTTEEFTGETTALNVKTLTQS